MNKRILIPTLVLAALLTGNLALAGPGGCGGDCSGREKGQKEMSYEQNEERMEQRLEMMSTVLDLTDEQKQQLETLFNQQWQDRQQLRKQMRVSRDNMGEARTPDNFVEADFRAKAAKHADLKTEMMVVRVKMKQQVYALLTPEQQAKADKLDGLMGDRGKKRHSGKGFRF